MDMGEDHIGAKAQQRRHAGQQPHPEERQPGEEQHRAPQRQQQPGLADIGLQQQDQELPARSSIRVMDRFGNGQRGAVGQHRGRQNGEAGLEKFGRLQAENSEIQFAARAQHIGADKQHQEGGDQRHGEYDGSGDLDLADRKQRGPPP